MKSKSVDLAIIGAGATGSCLAYEAAKRGLKSVLIDAGDIGCGTSCRSTKLLHGGVRYLELAFKTLDLAQLKLVREALLERSYWLTHAPFLTKRLELAIPTTNCFAKAYYRGGLALYDALSGRKNIGLSRSLSNSDLKEAIPLLQSTFNGGIAYSDGQFNDSRLNLLLALTAEKSGTIIKTHSKAVGFDQDQNGRLTGVISEDSSGEQELWKSKAIVNATGIYSDTIRKLADENVTPRIITSRGIHLILKENLCKKGIGLLMPSKDDGRVLFILPFLGKTMVGTTESSCSTEEACKPSNKEKEYLINYLKSYFPTLIEPEITSQWAGSRPLLKPKSEGIDNNNVVREHEIETLPCGLISAMGGKWTTCRQIALDTLKAIEALLNQKFSTRQSLPLIGSSQDPEMTMSLLNKQRNELKEYLPSSPLLEEQINHLQSKYGLHALTIIKDSPLESKQAISDVIPICKAEIDYDISHEHAQSPTDLLARRCRLAMIDLKEAKRVLPIIQERLSIAGLPPGELDLEH